MMLKLVELSAVAVAPALAMVLTEGVTYVPLLVDSAALVKFASSTQWANWNVVAITRLSTMVQPR